MKISRFNVIRQKPDITYAFNSFTSALAKVDSSFFSMMDYVGAGKNEAELSEKEIELLENMKYAGFVIDDSIDEISRLSQIQQTHRNNADTFSFTIAPTLNCNFGCPYCFETAKHGFMSDDVQQTTLTFIENKIRQAGTKKISVTWFGGEPLLAMNIVSSMSQKIGILAKEHSVTFNLMIITNGYLIDSAVADQLQDCGIKMAQVTVDGCEGRHNRRRFLKENPNEGTYSRILQGINLLTQRDIKVGIRMNVDLENIQDIETFVREMNLKISNTKNINISLGHVFSFKKGEMAFESNKCLSTERFAECKLTALGVFKQLGLSDCIKKEYPVMLSDYCHATYPNNFVIGPEGDMYRCWSDLGDISLSTGTVFIPPENNSTKCKKWNEYSVLNSTKCINCAVLPICAGGCPREQVYNGRAHECVAEKYNINRLIDFFADAKYLFEKEEKYGTHY
jgi:uncharacterized protein